MFGLGKKKHIVMTSVPDDNPRIADLHGLCFSDGWSGAEIAKLALQPTVTMLVTRPVGEPKAGISGFNIIRQTRDEAEILSIGVDPKIRRSGLAVSLMREAILRLTGDGVKALFLEVDSGNVSAVNLYRKLGFQTVGARPGYYKNPQTNLPQNGTPAASSALVMRLDLI